MVTFGQVRDAMKAHDLATRALSIRLEKALNNVDALVDKMLQAMRSQPQTVPFPMQEAIDRDLTIELTLANPTLPPTLAGAKRHPIETRRSYVF